MGEIKDDSHEIAAMALILPMTLYINKNVIINIIAAISWLPPLISQLFYPGF